MSTLKLTKKQRKDIYQKAIDIIKNDIGKRFLCGVLRDLSKNRLEWEGYERVAEAFPEFEMFSPTVEEEDTWGCTNDGCWFKFKYKSSDEQYMLIVNEDNAEYEQMERLICLELCLHLLEEAEE